MDRTEFHQLLKKYLEGNCSKEEEQLISQWYDLIGDEVEEPVTEDQVREIEMRIWNRIRFQTTGSPEADVAGSRKIRSFKSIKWIAAASVIFFSFLIVFLIQQKKPAITNPDLAHYKEIREEINTTNKVKSVVLEDGSEVQLQPNSRLAFPAHFAADKREVFFEGEGFFKVTRNTQRPFFVYNKNLVTEVLGTSFNIRIVNNKIVVAVKTGRVAVYENGKRLSIDSGTEEKRIIVAPNEKLTYLLQEKHFISSLVEKPEPVLAADGEGRNVPVKFIYDDTPLINVLYSIEKAYQIQIIIENAAINNCTFSGDITREDLYHKLELLCQAFKASYEIKGTKIYVKGGKGCN